MIDAQAEVFKRLVSDSAVISLLGTYNLLPAVMATPTPHDYTVGLLPCVIVDYPLGSQDDDSYTEEYRNVDLRVRMYSKPSPAQGGTQKLNLAAAAVYRSLKDWGPIALTGGGEVIAATVSGPVDAPTTDPTNAGRLFNVRLFLKES